LNQLLRAGAAVLSNSAGSASSYQLSKPVRMLALFLSHNWCVSRFRKFLTLSLYFNLGAATAAAFLAAVASFCLQASGLLPLVVPAPDSVAQKFKEIDRADAKMGVFVYLTTMPVFVLVVFFKPDLLRCICPGPLTFLDKVCIHQTDTKLKQEGISKLGAFLANSSRMLIIYSDLYLRKVPRHASQYR